MYTRARAEVIRQSSKSNDQDSNMITLNACVQIGAYEEASAASTFPLVFDMFNPSQKG